MKKSLLVIFMSFFLLLCGINLSNAQEQPAPKKDTVNMDTDAKPEFYYDVEDDENSNEKKGSNSTVIIIAGAVVVIGAAVAIALRKKKK